MTHRILALFLAIASAPALAQERSLSGPALTIRGQVVAAPDGVALRRARVVVTARIEAYPPVFTDDQGRFAVEASGAGPFTITIGKGGYAFARTTLSREEAAVPLTVRLPRGATLSGRAASETGAAAVGAVVSARLLEPELPGFPAYFSTTTDDLGAYRLSGLPAGRFEIATGPAPQTVPTAAMVALASWYEPARTASDEMRRSTFLREFGGTSIEITPFRTPTMTISLPNGSIAMIGGTPAPSSRNVTLRLGEEAGGVDFVVRAAESSNDVFERLRKAGVVSGETVEEPPRPPGMAASIRGRVTTADGRPIEDASVQLSGDGVVPTAAGGAGQRMYSDADGRYVLNGLREGTYRIEVSKPGHGAAFYGQEPDLPAGRSILLTKDQILDGIDVVLTGSSAIAGLLVDEHGEPLQSALAMALQLRHVGGRLTAAPASMPRRTDDQGRYRIFDLSAGSYLVAVSVDAVVSGSQTKERAGNVRVFYPGTPLVDAATPIEVTGPETIVNMAFTPVRSARVNGSALDAEGPLIAGTARLIRRGATTVMADPLEAGIRSDGTFQFPNVQPGEYAVQVRGDGPGRTGLFGVEYVSVADGDPAPVTVRTGRGATLEGRFTIEGEPECVGPPTSVVRNDAARQILTVRNCQAGRPASHFMIVPVGLDPDRVRPENTSSFVVSSEGTFYVSGLFGPTAFALRRVPSEGWFLKSVLIGGVDITHGGFDFGDGGGHTIDGAEIIVSRHGGTITGRVTERETPVTDYSVIVFPVYRDQWVPHSPKLRFAPAGLGGAFRVAGVPPGDYFVAAVDRIGGTPDGGEWQTPEVLTRLVAGATRITISEGQSRDATLGLVRRTTVAPPSR